MINWKNGWVIKGGQKYFTTNHEKGPRNKNLQIEERASLCTQVGPEHGPKTARAARSLWFDDPTREIS